LDTCFYDNGWEEKMDEDDDVDEEEGVGLEIVRPPAFTVDRISFGGK
jgi:hypothetical protein